MKNEIRLYYYAISENNHIAEKPFKEESVDYSKWPKRTLKLNSEGDLEEYQLKTINEKIGILLMQRLRKIEAIYRLREFPHGYFDQLFGNGIDHKYALRNEYFVICGDILRKTQRIRYAANGNQE